MNKLRSRVWDSGKGGSCSVDGCYKSLFRFFFSNLILNRYVCRRFFFVPAFFYILRGESMSMMERQTNFFASINIIDCDEGVWIWLIFLFCFKTLIFIFSPAISLSTSHEHYQSVKSMQGCEFIPMMTNYWMNLHKNKKYEFRPRLINKKKLKMYVYWPHKMLHRQQLS